MSKWDSEKSLREINRLEINELQTKADAQSAQIQTLLAKAQSLNRAIKEYSQSVDDPAQAILNKAMGQAVIEEFYPSMIKCFEETEKEKQLKEIKRKLFGD